MADERVYSDEEFALILREAAELASRVDSPVASSEGLTLTEMKSAARQAGLDPALVERAARMMSAGAPAAGHERLTGGPLRHQHEAHFSVELDQKRAERLLSAVRINAGVAGTRDVGHASAMGMTWHDGGELESLRITASPDEDGTTVSVSLDRRGTLGIVGVFSGMALLLALLFSVFALYPEAPALGVAGVISSIGGALAAVRGYWAASTRRARERISGVMEAIARTLSSPDVAITHKRTSGSADPGPGLLKEHAGAEREAIWLEAKDTGS